MFSRIQRYLTLFCGASAGVVLGRWLFFAWDYTAHPDLYAMFSAPWWVQPAVDTAIGAGLILIVLAVKALLWWWARRSQ